MASGSERFKKYNKAVRDGVVIPNSTAIKEKRERLGRKS